MSAQTPQDQPLCKVEHIKAKSRYLRGTIKESLADENSGALFPDDQQLIKFHGIYQQSDRSIESERKKQKLGPLYSFIIRIRVPAGIATTQQWLGIDALADQYGIGTIKLTTRQAFELHGVLKRNLKKAIKGINDTTLDTLAASGDVNRNVMASASPHSTRVHGQVLATVRTIHAHLSPNTSAYREIWIDDKLTASGELQDNEPIYGKTYLPRKFKIAFAIPPVNDPDVFANDLGFIAIVESDALVGFNVLVGGGMGCTFGIPETFPRIGTVIGFISKDKALDVAERVVTIQRDNGNRSNRKLSRLKYTVERMGIDGFKAELEKRLGFSLEAARPYQFKQNGDVFGWQKGEDGKWHVTLFVEGGRVKDTEAYPLKAGLREIARVHAGVFILTGNQNLVIANINAKDKPCIEGLLLTYGISTHQMITGARSNSLACVAMPLCPLAFADAETYLPLFMDKLDVILNEIGLKDAPINVRMTGCPNACARPFFGEIAMIGRAPGKYNLYLGASPTGDRLNILFKEKLSEEDILTELRPMLAQYSRERQKEERFGDFVMRKDFVKSQAGWRQSRQFILQP